MDSGSSYGKSEKEVGAQPGVQRSRLRSGAPLLSAQEEPQIPRRSGRHGVQGEPQVYENNPWFDMDDNQQDQVRCGYEPISVSTPKDRGMLPTQVKCEIGLSPRD